MLAHYRLVAKIGEGGMGVVWRAVDTTLDREVAIKILPDVFASDRERLQRFEREAKVLASLNHSGIASIFGLHQDGNVRFLAMEFAPGESLSERLLRGPIPVEQAIDIARQIAEALESAHEMGIVHRDLKPANVVVTPAGQVKVLDFGLAKALTPETMSGEYSITNSPTITTPATLMGTILGTAAYMSPEQARGGMVDKRADIWAFGCVLLEMLTGQRTFDGGTVTDTLAAVLRADIEMEGIPAETPRAVRELLARCLDRDARTRLRDAGEARILLGQSFEPERTQDRLAVASRSSRGLWIAAVLVACASGLFAGRALFRSTPAEMPKLTFTLELPGQRLRNGSLALSPDGEKLVLQVQRSDGTPELWLRTLAELEAKPLPGTEGGQYPFWAPDSREIGFFADGQLFRLPIAGGSARPICSVADPVGGAWNRDGVILVGQERKPLHRIDAAGGELVAIGKLRPREEEHAWPSFLPDGDHFIFLADANTFEAHRVVLGSLSSGEITDLREGVRSSIAYDARAGVLLTERRQLLAFPLDVEGRRLTTQGSLVADMVAAIGNNHATPFSVSANGVLAVQHGTGGYRMLRMEREGTELAQYGKIEHFANPAISPDGRRVLFELTEMGDEVVLWMLDLERGVRSAVSEPGHRSDSGAWSADGRTVYFDSDADSTRPWVAYKRAADGGAPPIQLGKPDGTLEASVQDCSADGRWLLASCPLSSAGSDLFLGRLDADGMVSEWINWTDSPGVREPVGCFSPDSRYIAYASDASGQNDIYVAPLEGGPTAHRWQVSTEGGTEPRFSPDGGFLHYRALKDRLMTAKVIARADDELTLSAPVAGLELREPETSYYRNTFDVFPDGALLVLSPIDAKGAAVEIRTGWWPGTP